MVIGLCHGISAGEHQATARTRANIGQWHQAFCFVFVLLVSVAEWKELLSRDDKALTVFHAGYAMDWVHLDILGPLPKTVQENFYALVMDDQFPKR